MMHMKQNILMMLTGVLMVGCTSSTVRMHEAAFDGNAPLVQRYLHRGVSANAMTRSGTTSLHAAAYRGNGEIVEILLAHGASPNLVDGRGWIPLHQAVDRGHAFIAERLIKAGANVNARMGYSGYTTLDWANHRRWPGLAAMLRKFGGRTSAELNLGTN